MKDKRKSSKWRIWFFFGWKKQMSTWAPQEQRLQSVKYKTLGMWKCSHSDQKRRETSSCEAQRTCEPAWFPIYCLGKGSMYLYSWLNKSTVFVGVCTTGPEFRESLPMEIGQFSAGGVWRLFSKRRWRFLLVVAQPVNGACLLPSITGAALTDSRLPNIHLH